jgi:hypothetical protein
LRLRAQTVGTNNFNYVSYSLGTRLGEPCHEFEQVMSKAKVGEDLWKNRVEKVVFLLDYCE